MKLKYKMYSDYATWWPLLSAPEDYAEEAEFYRGLINAEVGREVKSILELGSGGGNNASHLKQYFQLTLVDISPGMLAVSERLNPACKHIQGDMRSVRLDRQFDAVFITDAIDYITSLEELRQTFQTAYLHCKPGGLALFHPDVVLETFSPQTTNGGHDGKNRALRYLEWSWDPDPHDDIYRVEYVLLLRDESGHVISNHETHHFGLFQRKDWLGAIEEVGFQAKSIPFEHSELESGTSEVFIATKPH